jgi:hypothetical protein
MMKGFGFTPNTDIPLNNRAPGEIAQVAIDQLQPYVIAAETWPVYRQYRDERHEMICRICAQCLWFLSDTHNVPYEYTDEEIHTLITAHIRRQHADMVNEKGEFTYEGAREYQVLDNTRGSQSYGCDSGNTYRPEYQGSDSRGIERTKEANP